MTNTAAGTPIKARMIRKGMTINGRRVTSARRGAGSARYWVYVTYADDILGIGGRYRVGDIVTLSPAASALGTQTDIDLTLAVVAAMTDNERRDYRDSLDQMLRTPGPDIDTEWRNEIIDAFYNN